MLYNSGAKHLVDHSLIKVGITFGRRLVFSTFPRDTPKRQMLTRVLNY